MKIVKIIAMALAVLAAAFIAGGLLLSGEFDVSRTLSMKAPAEKVYEQVIDLKKTQAWMPFTKTDPTYKITYGEKTRGPGASYAWKGDSGSGSLRIVKARAPFSIENELKSPDMGTTHAIWTFEKDQPEHVRVTWRFRGRAPGIMGAWIALIMDPMLGKYFEQGLRDLKNISEKSP